MHVFFNHTHVPQHPLSCIMHHHATHGIPRMSARLGEPFVPRVRRGTVGLGFAVEAGKETKKEHTYHKLLNHHKPPKDVQFGGVISVYVTPHGIRAILCANSAVLFLLVACAMKFTSRSGPGKVTRVGNHLKTSKNAELQYY